MIVQTVSEWDFIEEFKYQPNNFSYHGLKTLNEYLEDYSEDTGENIELDTIAIMDEFQEFRDWQAYEEQYGYLGYFQVRKPCCDICKEYRHKENLEKLSEYTTVIPITLPDYRGGGTEGFIIQTNF